MKQRTKIGKALAFKANNEIIEKNINELLTVLNTIANTIYKDKYPVKIKINHCPIKDINDLKIEPSYFADLVFSIENFFFVVKFINRRFPIDINTKIWKEKIIDNKINQKISGGKNWHDITEQIKFNLLKSELKDYIGYNCVILNKQPIGRNQNKMAFIGLLDHFKTWIQKIIIPHINAKYLQSLKQIDLLDDIQN